jgi:hypothetical protein
VPTGWLPDGFRVASRWLRGGRNPPWSFFASVDTQPARGNRGLQGIDPGFRLLPTNICGHFLSKTPFCWALSKRHSVLTPLLDFGPWRLRTATPASRPALPGCGAKRPCRSSGLRRRCRSARPKGPSPCSLIWLRAKTNAKPQAPSNPAPRSNSNLRLSLDRDSSARKGGSRGQNEN